VVAKATRRQFTLEYKRKIVREADGCKTPGAIGALLRRELNALRPVTESPDPPAGAASAGSSARAPWRSCG
jgi:hypothetical protein